jgi:hypothetical protein
MPVVGEHIAVQDWPIDVESDLKEGSILVKVGRSCISESE